MGNPLVFALAMYGYMLATSALHASHGQPSPREHTKSSSTGDGIALSGKYASAFLVDRYGEGLQQAFVV